MVVLKIWEVGLGFVDAGEESRVFLLFFGGGGEEIPHVALDHFY